MAVPRLPAVMTVPCSGTHHVIMLTRDLRFVLLDHDVKRESVALGFGKKMCTCFWYYGEWRDMAYGVFLDEPVFFSVLKAAGLRQFNRRLRHAFYKTEGAIPVDGGVGGVAVESIR